jgi:hypothetical protein
MYKAMISDNLLVGNVIDNEGNFEVVFFGIQEKCLENNLRVNKYLNDKKVISIYCLHKNTREFVMFEIDAEELENIFQSQICIEDVNKINDITKEHWWVKVYKSQEEIVKEKDVMYVENNNEIRFSSSRSTHEDKHKRTFTYEDGPGNCYKYVIDIEAFSDIRDTGDGDPDTYGVEIIDQKFYCNDGILIYLEAIRIWK